MSRKILVVVAALLAVLVLCLTALPQVQKRSDVPAEPMDTTAPVTSEETQEVTTEDTVPTETETTEPMLDGEITLEEVPSEMTKSTESTQPTEATKPSDNKKPTEPSGNKKPTETTQPAETTKPTEATKPSQGGKSAYETYMSMSPSEQKAFRASFGSTAEFFAWYNAAKDEYERNNGDQEVGDGSVDLEDVMNG